MATNSLLVQLLGPQEIFAVVRWENILWSEMGNEFHHWAKCPHLWPPALPFDPVTHLAMMSPVHSATVTASLLAGEETRREDTEPEVDMDRDLVDINTEEERQCFLYQG